MFLSPRIKNPRISDSQTALIRMVYLHRGGPDSDSSQTLRTVFDAIFQTHGISDYQFMILKLLFTLYGIFSFQIKKKAQNPTSFSL